MSWKELISLIANFRLGIMGEFALNGSVEFQKMKKGRVVGNEREQLEKKK